MSDRRSAPKLSGTVILDRRRAVTMAFDRLDANRHRILRLQDAGRTLAEIAADLSRQQGVETTPATLSRYLKAIGRPQKARGPAVTARTDVDVNSATAALIAALNHRMDEQHAAAEALAAEVARIGAAVEGLEWRVAALADQVARTRKSWHIGRLGAGLAAGVTTAWGLLR